MQFNAYRFSFLLSILLVLFPIIEGLPSWLYTRKLRNGNIGNLGTNSRRDLNPKILPTHSSNIKLLPPNDDIEDEVLSILANSLLNPLSYILPDEFSQTSDLPIITNTIFSTVEPSSVSLPTDFPTSDLFGDLSSSSFSNSPLITSLTDITTNSATLYLSSGVSTITETVELSLLPTITASCSISESLSSQLSYLSSNCALPEIISSSSSLTLSSESSDLGSFISTCIEVAPTYSSSSFHFSSLTPIPTDIPRLVSTVTETITLIISSGGGSSDVSILPTDETTTDSATIISDTSLPSTATLSEAPCLNCSQFNTIGINISNIQPTNTNQLSLSNSGIETSGIQTSTSPYSTNNQTLACSSKTESESTSSISQSTIVLPTFATESSSSSPSSISQIYVSPTPYFITTVPYTEYETLILPSKSIDLPNYPTSFPGLLNPGTVSPSKSLYSESTFSSETISNSLGIPLISDTPPPIIISEGFTITLLPLLATSNSNTLESTSTVDFSSFESPSISIEPTLEIIFPGTVSGSTQTITTTLEYLSSSSPTSFSQPISTVVTQSDVNASPSQNLPGYYAPLFFP